MKKLTCYFYTLFSIIFFCINCHGQDSTHFRRIPKDKLPKAVHYHSKTIAAIEWEDVEGDHIVILEETGYYRNPDLKHLSDGSDAELYAGHYCYNGVKKERIWKLEDFIYDCPVDMAVSYMEDMPLITDLDKDSIPEIWLIYQTVCHGDVSPLTVKIIIYEGKQKYAIRGQSKVMGGIDEHGRTHYLGGTYTYDPAFAKQTLFLDHAKALWKQFVLNE